MFSCFFTPQEAGVAVPRVGVGTGSGDSLSKRRGESGRTHMLCRMAERVQEGWNSTKDLSVFVGRAAQGRSRRKLSVRMHRTGSVWLVHVILKSAYLKICSWAFSRKVCECHVNGVVTPSSQQGLTGPC